MSTTPGLLPMESYRLAKYAIPFPCFICGGDNAFDAHVCRHCQAPMALAYQAGLSKTQPQLLATLGTTGAGKTVYLGMLLDILSNDIGPLQGLARGAFSITLQQTVLAALARCEFPGETPDEPECWDWVHCQVRAKGRRRPVEVVMPDMAGNTLARELDQPGSVPVVREFLKNASAVLVLVDPTEVEDGTNTQDCFAMKVLSYLSELESEKRKRRRQRVVAIVFTKADECPECFDDPAAYAQKRTPGLWQHCQVRFAKHRFFAASVVGACHIRDRRDGRRIQVPVRVEPHGVVEPFAWLVGQMGK
jgi:hypothetical protein